MTVLEQRFMERVPILLNDIVKNLETLNKRLEKIEKKLEENGKEN